MKALFDILNSHDFHREALGERDARDDSAWKQVAYAIAGGTSMALFLATIHLQAM